MFNQTGRTQRAQTDRILGLSDHDSEELLHELWRYMYDPANCFTHWYRPGDLVIWDNLNVQHGRPAGEPDVPRTLRRVIFGEKAPWEEWPLSAPAE